MSERQANTPTLRALLPSRLVPEDMLSEWQGPNLPNTKNYAPPPDSMRGRMGDVLMQGIAALGGFTGLPMSGEGDRAALMGELLAAGMPLVGGVKGTLKNLVSRTLTNGFYSRLDEAAAMIPKKGVPATGVMNWLKKAPEGISTEEVAYRKLPEWLASQGTKTVTPEMLASHLRENPAPFPTVKTLQNHPSGWTADDSVALDELESLGHRRTDAQDEAYQRLIDRENTASNPGVPPTLPKFSQYQVPGGENYRETLLTLPSKGLPFDEWAKQYRDFDPSVTPEQLQKAYAKYQAGDSGITVRNPAEFRSSHYPDDPNLLVHTRSNDRTLPSGEPGRFVEEVQSDWHQKGVKQGYRIPGDRDRANDLLRQMDEIEREVGLAQASQDPRYRALGAELDTASTQNPSGVPDAPFKENWPDLGLKQQLIEAANDPNAEWLGFTGGKTQADRYDLSKQISQIEADRYIVAGENGWRVKADDMEGTSVPLPTHYLTDSQLADTFGKDMAKRIIERDGGVFEGLDLQVGGEGMTAFYDQKLPKRLEKIVKPFGGTVEPVSIEGSAKTARNRETRLRDLTAQLDQGPLGREERAELNELMRMQNQDPMEYSEMKSSRISRLTPEMKDAIKRGVPLMSIVAAALSAGLISTADAQQIKQQGYR